jgi:sarcosine oxidase subunit beta
MRSGHPAMLVTEPLPLVMDVSTGVEGGGIYARQVARGNCVLGGGQGFALSIRPGRVPVKAAILEILRRPSSSTRFLKAPRRFAPGAAPKVTCPIVNRCSGTARTQPGLLHAFGFAGLGVSRSARRWARPGADHL